jgi:acetyl-CoA carboxylase biotin carboxyl carrier protein
MSLKPNDIATLVELFNTSGWEEMHVEIDGLQLFISKDPKARLVSGLGGGTSTAAPALAAPAVRSTAPAAEPAAPAASDIPAHWLKVAAPNLGTFYRSPKPGAAPFVSVGDRVTAETEVCLLEVMKLFTAVKAGVAGIVRRIGVEDGSLVEHGTVLFYVEPA